MKRQGYLFDQIIDKSNITKAIIKSSKGKSKRREVIKVLGNIDVYVEKIHKMLKFKSYNHFDYKIINIYDANNKKERTLSKPLYFPDQIIHYCLMNVLEPILLKKFYRYSCANIKGKGTSFGQNNLRKWLDNDVKGTKYCLKLDIKKFFPSINKSILSEKFTKIIKDKDCLWLINKIIYSNCKGVPLGNYTSAYFANFFLNDLDNYIKQELKVKYYLRYVDDLVLLSGNKKHLKKALSSINEFLNKESLILKKNHQIFNIYDRDIDFLGYRFFRDKTILRKRNMFKISRKAQKVYKKELISFKDATSIISYYGWIKHSDSYNFYHKRVKPYAMISEMKKIISSCGKIL